MVTTFEKSNERGFSYLDVMIAMTILLVGILTLGAALTAALVQTTSAESQLRAKALASSTLESVMSARWVKVGGNAYTFDALQNTTTPPGVFLANKHDIHEGAGPDGLLGTSDDNGAVIPGFKRQITITNVINPLRPSIISERRITVNITYVERGIERQESLSTNVAVY